MQSVIIDTERTLSCTGAQTHSLIEFLTVLYNCRYSAPDPRLRREYDMRISLRVPTVQATYVHTHRYMCHLIDYWMHFLMLHEKLAAHRAVQRGEEVGKTQNLQ